MEHDSGFTASTDFVNTIEKSIHLHSMTIGVLYDFNAWIANFESGVFNSRATEDIANQNKKDFEHYYGNSYVKQAYLGGVMMILLSADSTESSKITKSQLKEALTVKYKLLFEGNVSKQDSLSMESTLKTVHIDGKLISSAGNVGLSDIICSKERIDAAVTEFSNYYTNAMNGVEGYDLNVYKMQLDPYYMVNSNAYSINQFPDYYDPAVFSSGILTASHELSNRSYINLAWKDICSFEDGYRIYYQNSTMTPTVVTTTSANATSVQISVPELNTGVQGKFWVVPVKNEVEGRYTNSSTLGKNTLYQNERLRPNEYLLSDNGKYQLIMQSDGNLCLYNLFSWHTGLESVWQSGTSKNPGGYAEMGQSQLRLWKKEINKAKRMKDMWTMEDMYILTSYWGSHTGGNF